MIPESLSSSFLWYSETLPVIAAWRSVIGWDVKIPAEGVPVV
jgi:hypothetical protein